MSNAAVVRRVYNMEGGDPVAFYFDTVHKENFVLGAKATQNPVAQGSPITDHVYEEPDQLTITVGVSNVVPFWMDQSGKSIEQHEADGDADFDPYYVAGQTRSQVALARLEKLKKDHVLVNVQTGLKLFSSMLLETISGTVEEGTEEVLQADLKFVGIRTVRVRVSKYPPRKDDKTKRGAGQTKKKKTEATKPDPAAAKQAYIQRLMAGDVDGIHHDRTSAEAIAEFRAQNGGF